MIPAMLGKRLLVAVMALMFVGGTLHSQTVQTQPQSVQQMQSMPMPTFILPPINDCAIVAAELCARLRKLNLPCYAIGLKLQRKDTGQKGGHAMVVWSPFQDGPVYLSDRTGAILITNDYNTPYSTVCQLIKKLIAEKSDSVATEIVYLW